MRTKLRERLYLSTIAEDAPEVAEKYGLGLELTDFCTARNLDGDFAKRDEAARKKIQGIERVILHAPFNELFTAAIDPLVLDVTYRRYAQAVWAAGLYGAKNIIFHSTFVPQIYFLEWFIPRSVEFWKTFLQEVPEDVCCCIENVMDPGPGPLVDIVKNVGDCRLRLCLDLGHINVASPQQSMETWIKTMAPWVAHIHVHNNYGQQDTHNPLWDGTVPMAQVLDCLSKEAPEATMTLETTRSEPSVRWLRERGFL